MYFMSKKVNLPFSKTTKILAAILLSTSSAFSYADEAELAKYQQARIAVTYKGNVGELAQQLAEKLGISYYAAQHNSSIQVKLKQADSHTLQNLLDEANRQLTQQNSPQQLRFDMLDDKVVLALVGNNVNLGPTQFIGNVVYDEVKHQDTIKKEQDEQNVISKPIVVETTEKNEKSESNQPAKLIDNIPEVSKPNEEISSDVEGAEAKKLRDILAVSQDNKLIAQYAKRKVPSYSVTDQQSLGLETIRSTKISTFLIFKDGIDMSKYKIEGKFQDIAIVGNVVAILHRQKMPPQEILITSPEQKSYKVTKTN